MHCRSPSPQLETTAQEDVGHSIVDTFSPESFFGTSTPETTIPAIEPQRNEIPFLLSPHVPTFPPPSAILPVAPSEFYGGPWDSASGFSSTARAEYDSGFTESTAPSYFTSGLSLSSQILSPDTPFHRECHFNSATGPSGMNSLRPPSAPWPILSGDDTPTSQNVIQQRLIRNPAATQDLYLSLTIKPPQPHHPLRNILAIKCPQSPVSLIRFSTAYQYQFVRYPLARHQCRSYTTPMGIVTPSVYVKVQIAKSESRGTPGVKANILLVEERDFSRGWECAEAILGQRLLDKLYQDASGGSGTPGARGIETVNTNSRTGPQQPVPQQVHGNLSNPGEDDRPHAADNHTLVHHVERPEICLPPTCHNVFASNRDRNKHRLSNGKGNLARMFCSGGGSANEEKAFTRVPTRSSWYKRIRNIRSRGSSDPQISCDHLDDSVLGTIDSGTGHLRSEYTRSSISQDPRRAHDSGLTEKAGMVITEEAGNDNFEKVDFLACLRESPQEGSLMPRNIAPRASSHRAASSPASSLQTSSLVEPLPSALYQPLPSTTIPGFEEALISSSPSAPSGTSNCSSPGSETSSPGSETSFSESEASISGSEASSSGSETSSSGSETSSSGSETSSCQSPVSLHALMERRKSALVDHLVDRLLACLQAKFTILGYQSRGSDSPTSRPADAHATQRDIAPSSQRPSKKHRRSSGDDGDDGDDPEDGGDGGGGGMRKRWEGQDGHKRRFACPFLKHNREKYKTRQSCAWLGFQTVHRVKEHLYRCHLIPRFRCLRCGDDKKSREELVAHLQATEPCLAQPLQPDDRITDAQEQRLKSRKRRKISEQEKWGEMYKILFPDDKIPSPYHEPPLPEPISTQPLTQATVLSSFEHYARHEFTRQMRPELEAIADRALQEQLSTDTVVEIAQGVLQRVIRSFEQDQLVPVSGGAMQQTTGVMDTPNNQEIVRGDGERGNDVPQDIAQHDVDNNNAGEHTANDEDKQGDSMINNNAPTGTADGTLLGLNFEDIFQDVVLNPPGDLSGVFDEWIVSPSHPSATQPSDS